MTTWQDMTDAEILTAIQGSISISTDPDTRQEWIWAGYADHEEPGDGSAACRELARRGLLTGYEVTDGYHTWALTPDLLRPRVSNQGSQGLEPTEPPVYTMGDSGYVPAICDGAGCYVRPEYLVRHPEDRPENWQRTGDSRRPWAPIRERCPDCGAMTLVMVTATSTTCTDPACPSHEIR